MQISEKRAMELMDNLHRKMYVEHRAWDCATTAINHKETHDILVSAVRDFQRKRENGKLSEDRHEIMFLCHLGEIAARHYAKLFPTEYSSWNKVMDVPTRCACGQRIANLFWEH